MPRMVATEEEVRLGVIKARCEDDHLFFTRYFFKVRNDMKFRVNWHHVLFADTVERIIAGEIKNAVINVPPGSSKTEEIVINLIARGLALNPRSRFLHISSGDELALLNSQTARDIITGDEFQELWPMAIASDTKAKKRWNVMMERPEGKPIKAGGVYAVALGGAITGFRAGHMAEGFQGAIIIDDPLKADDAFSKIAIADANRKLLSTVKSRKANPDTPTIVVMQRLAENDPTGFIKNGNLPGEWEFIEIPALITDEYVEKLPPHIRKLVDRTGPRDDQGRFSYWEYKEPLETLLQMEAGSHVDKEGARISRFVFASQYMQKPKALGGNLIRGEWFKRYKVLPKLDYRKQFADTAQKTAERNDYSVVEEWGHADGRVYLTDLVRGKWEAPDLKRRVVDFWNKGKAQPAATHGVLRKLGVEDKSSGTGLIQDIRRDGGIPIQEIPRDRDKLTRVMDVVSYIEAGLVYIPEDAPWVNDFIAECEAFTSDDSHAHDDQIDPMCDAISDMIGPKPTRLFG